MAEDDRKTQEHMQAPAFSSCYRCENWRCRLGIRSKICTRNSSVAGTVCWTGCLLWCVAGTGRSMSAARCDGHSGGIGSSGEDSGHRSGSGSGGKDGSCGGGGAGCGVGGTAGEPSGGSSVWRVASSVCGEVATAEATSAPVSASRFALINIIGVVAVPAGCGAAGGVVWHGTSRRPRHVARSAANGGGASARPAADASAFAGERSAAAWTMRRTVSSLTTSMSPA